MKFYDLLLILICIMIKSELTNSWSANPSCWFEECCNADGIPNDIYKLYKKLKNHVYGQPFTENIVHAISSHWDPSNKPKKALTLSFHGWTGSGKSYVSNFIAESLYKYGSKSKFVHNFIGRIHFPLEGNILEYKQNLYGWLKGNVSSCPKQLFIFDEVHGMPEGVLNALTPLIDYRNDVDGVDYTQCIFLFLSNTGAKIINQNYLEYWKSGKKREDLHLNDFENIVMKGSFNEKGGFHYSDTIKSNLIDHYIPFLPMEMQHVRNCIKDQFRDRQVFTPQEKHIREILDFIQWGPDQAKVFSKSGCKRISAKVSLIVAKYYNSDKTKEL